MKVEYIFLDPGTIPDADLSSHCVGLLALTSEMALGSWRMCVLIDKILTYCNTSLEHKIVPLKKKSELL